MYDAAIGRWFVVDTLAEKTAAWTPYRYGFKNPMKFMESLNGPMDMANMIQKILLFLKPPLVEPIILTNSGVRSIEYLSQFLLRKVFHLPAIS
jgi:hypothetical protein